MGRTSLTSLNVDTLRKAMVRRFVSMAGVVLLIVGAMAAAGKTLRRDPALSVTPGSGRTFRDLLVDGQPCVACPEMVVVPGGTFVMGSPLSEEARGDNEGPQHKVAIALPFAVGRFAVTFEQWDACVALGGCNGTGHTISARFAAIGPCDVAELALVEHGSMKRGTLSIQASETIAAYWLPRHLVAFRKS
jgi:formylglycine-generating enzyme required for sulfatase activity